MAGNGSNASKKVTFRKSSAWTEKRGELFNLSDERQSCAIVIFLSGGKKWPSI